MINILKVQLNAFLLNFDVGTSDMLLLSYKIKLGMHEFDK